MPEVELNHSIRIREEGYLGGLAVSKFVCREQIVSGTGHQPRVADLHLRTKLNLVAHLPTFVGSKVSTREMHDHRIVPLQFR